MSNETTYYDVNEVAEKLGLHPETIRRKARAGKIEAYRLEGSGEYRFTNEAIKAYVEKYQPETV